MAVNNGFSLVIPTFREAKNIPALVRKIASVDFGSRPFEVLLIDDNSQDGIVEIVDDLSKQFSWLKLIVRQAKRDLSQSVIDGFKLATYPILITMDADLSHPAEKIPAMLAALEEPGVEVAIGSRYVPGGSMDDIWPLSRKMASRLAAWLAKILLRVNLKDPLSGFLAIRKETLDKGDPLDVIGWKWGLEVMIKCHCKQIHEVPIHFSQRKYGSSKLNLKITLNYFQHIKRLAAYKMSTNQR